MDYFWVLCSILLTFPLITATLDEDKPRNTAKMYATIIENQRSQQVVFLEKLFTKPYEEKFKMIKLALEEILGIAIQVNLTFVKSQYSPKEGFPQNVSLQEALVSVVENICFAGDLILHFPEITRRALKQYADWRGIINWGLEVIDDIPELVDEKTRNMLYLLRQEINVSERSADYYNPYAEIAAMKASPKPKKEEKKKKKRLKKGPRLIRTEL